MVALGTAKESAMSDTERRELTAAELDLVVGAAIYMKIDASDFMAPRNGETTSKKVTMEDILITSVTGGRP
jgi:hypothetical protein